MIVAASESYSRAAAYTVLDPDDQLSIDFKMVYCGTRISISENFELKTATNLSIFILLARNYKREKAIRKVLQN